MANFGSKNDRFWLQWNMQIPIVSLVPDRFFFPSTRPLEGLFGTSLESVWL